MKLTDKRQSPTDKNQINKTLALNASWSNYLVYNKGQLKQTIKAI